MGHPESFGSLSERHAAEVCDSCGHLSGIHYRSRGVCRANECNCQAFKREIRQPKNFVEAAAYFDPKAGRGYYGKSDE